MTKDRLSEAERIPAECEPASFYIKEEMAARGWTDDDLHARLGSDPRDHFAVDLVLAVNDPNLILDDKTSAVLGRAFNVDPDLFANLDKAWRRWKSALAHTHGEGRSG